jgi:hypothetical protein
VSYNPNDHVNDHDDVVCGCGITFDFTTTLRVCAHPGCEKAICSDCLVKCECCPRSFCAEHVSAVDDLVVCLRCESVDMLADELLDREAGERAALVARLRSGFNPVPASMVAQAIIRHAQGVRA